LKIFSLHIWRLRNDRLQEISQYMMLFFIGLNKLEGKKARERMEEIGITLQT
jgi:hypothetical protein